MYKVTFMVQRAHHYEAGSFAATVWDAERIESREQLKKVTHRIAEEAAESYDGPAYVLAYEEMPDGTLLTNHPRYIVGYDPTRGVYMVPEDHFLYGPFAFVGWDASVACDHEGERYDSVENGILNWYCADCGYHTGSMPLIIPKAHRDSI